MEENLYRLVLGEKDAELIFERSVEECVLGEELEEIPHFHPFPHGNPKYGYPSFAPFQTACFCLFAPSEE